MTWDLLPEAIKQGITRQVEQEQREIRHSPNVVWISETDGCILKSFYRRTLPLPMDFRRAVALWRGSLLHPVLLCHLPQTEVPVSYPVLGEEGLTLRGRIDGIDEDGRIVELKCTSSLFYMKRRNRPNKWDVKRLMTYARIRGSKQASLYYIDFSDALHFPLEVDMGEAGRTLIEKVELAKALSRALKNGEPPEPLNVLEFEDGRFECGYCEYRGMMCEGRG